MAHDDEGAAGLENVSQGRQRGLNAAVVGDVAGRVLGDVEIDPDEDPFALEVRQVGEGFLGHWRRLWRIHGSSHPGLCWMG